MITLYSHVDIKPISILVLSGRPELVFSDRHEADVNIGILRST